MLGPSMEYKREKTSLLSLESGVVVTCQTQEQAFHGNGSLLYMRIMKEYNTYRYSLLPPRAWYTRNHYGGTGFFLGTTGTGTQHLSG